MAEAQISLRELREKLKLSGRYSQAEARAKLLSFLRKGVLIARFDYPSNKRPQISVPGAYWHDVKINEFRKALSGNNKHKGDYVVSSKQFASEYLKWFSEKYRLPEDFAELSTALQAGGIEAEVYVLEKDWEEFTSREDLDTTQHSTKN